ncbi:PHD and RING finger domain-containing protein 1 isoform X1 [Eptesicus fuscus]|uniref:PHD and RING finger domain-containing protein 1 isoform X1 n=1 Tax=Eptesicus fuscus TaxID=29078 RepID=UPI002403CE98|nr:PHD and RING finger domain-containing protein 1 isoform X1 [Eptesicus fuscus]XP_054580774.1 PHD and RING finger domain-containing protein 1 isoform X1 [Eptesicus fuscus]XP_054580775.1 PHD and RING finger domain-containing protein 1 isoform X1 [Eptesicus fuscus]
MDEDSLDELVEHSLGPDAHLGLGAATVASDAEESSDGASGGSEDTGSELSDSTDGEEEGDPEDGAGSEGSEDDDSDDDDDVEALVAADPQGKLQANGVCDSDDEAESCPICLNTFRDQAVGTPESCAHYFCLDCILEWAKNANSCPVDRTLFKCICIRAQFGGKVLKKVPVESARAGEEEEDPTFCEVCGRSDREDRLLLCDGCDAGYHMECLDPPLQEVPVDEWFCPGCASPGAAALPADADPVTEEEVSLLLVDVVPTASRLRPREGRTRAIARTRQSERVRATVNRNRMSTARSIQHVPRYLVSSLLDETIEAVASGLSTAVYQRPTTPRAPAKRRRKARRRRKALGRKKARPGPAVRSRSSGTRPARRQGRGKKRKGRKLKAAQSEVTARGRIARTLGLRRPTHGACIPSVFRPADPSLGLMRADIGAASLSVFGDPYELDPFDSSEEPPASPASPLSAKRRVLSRSALRSHQPVARPVSMGLSRRSIPAAAPEPDVDEAPVPDLLGSILSGQSLLMMDSADITIHRDGSLSAKRAAPVSFQRNSVGLSRGGEGPGPRDGPQPPAPSSGCLGSLGSRSQGRSTPSHVPALTSGVPARLDSSAAPRPDQAQSSSNVSSPGFKRREGPHVRGDSEHAGPLGLTPKISGGSPDLPARSAGPGQAPRPAPRRADVSQLPRAPKMRRDGGSGWADTAPVPAPAPAGGQRVEIPSSCISRLTGREGPGQPGLGARAEGSPRGRGPQEPSVHSGGGAQTPAPLGPSRGKGGSSTFESFRINIPGNAAHSSRFSSPGFCHTFQPVDSKVPRKENPAPLFSLRKTKQLKSEIYDPFNPTGSDSSSAGSSPERLGPGLLPSEITRTISVGSPKAPPSQTVRCVTSYTVKAVFGTEPESPQGPSSSLLQLRGEEPAGGLDSAPRVRRPSPREPWEDEDRPPRSTFFGSEERMVTCVTVVEPDTPPTTTHRIVELRSPSRSRSRSTSSSRGRERDQKPASAPEHRHTRSRSGDGSSRSSSPLVGEDQAKRPLAKARARRSSSDRSSSHEQAKRKKAKDKSRERRRDSRGRGRRRSRSRSRSGSPGSSSHEHRESRRRKKRRSGSRSHGRGCSPPSSLERARRPRRPSERSREWPRDRRGSRERRRHKSRSPSPEHRAREPRRPRSREKRSRPRSRSRSPERKLPVKEASPAPPPQEEPRPGRQNAAGLQAAAGTKAWPDGAEADQAPPTAPPAPEVPAEGAPEDLDYVDSVEAGHVFDDFASEGIFTQLDDMSSPPSPESTDSSSPERRVPPPPTAPPARPQQDHSLAAIRREVSLIHSEDAEQPLPWTTGPQEKASFQQDQAMAAVPGALGGPAGGGALLGKEEAPCPTSVLRTKAPVKRVTWNLQEAAGGAPAEDRGLRTPLHRPCQPQEEAWEPGDGALVVDSQQAPCPEPPPAYTLPEPGFPTADPAQVYGPSLPPALALPSSVPPYAPVSQPTVQFILQGSLPLAGCGAAPSLAPVPTVLTTASEPAGHAAATNNSEERTATPRPATEKAKNEEYLKKLHMQERAVEEVKLAIKPFYQKREVTKEEYKDILRKAVQKICHSKSGEINPVKVGNLVKAYVDKYRHMRRHRRPEAGEEPAAEG